MITPMDPTVEQSITRAVGHGPAFSSDEYGGVAALELRHAETLDGIERLSGLRELRVFACNVRDLAQLASLTQLRTLEVVCTPVVDLDPLVACQALERLELIFTSAEDVEPILKLPRLRSARLIGNPWSEKSFHEARLAFWTDQSRPSTATEFSDRTDWELTRELRAAGLAVSFAHVDGVRPLLVKPGFGALANSEADWAPATPAGARFSMTQQGITADLLVLSYVSEAERQAAARPFDARSHRTVGTRDDAVGWIDHSDLPDADRAALRRFVDRFPALTFFRDDDALLDELMAQPRHRITLPAWLRQTRRTLAGVLPQARIAVQFDSYDGYCLRQNHITESWHTLALWGYGFEEQRRLLCDGAGVYPIGQWAEQWQSTLAISLTDTTDRQIYEFFEQDIAEPEADGESGREEMLPVFHSYASMLGHVVAIRVDDAAVIRAR